MTSDLNSVIEDRHSAFLQWDKTHGTGNFRPHWVEAQLIQLFGTEAYDMLQSLYDDLRLIENHIVDIDWNDLLTLAALALQSREVYEDFQMLDDGVKLRIISESHQRNMDPNYFSEIVRLCIITHAKTFVISESYVGGNWDNFCEMLFMRNPESALGSARFRDHLWAYIESHAYTEDLVTIFYLLFEIFGEDRVAEIIDACLTAKVSLRENAASRLVFAWDEIKDQPIEWAIETAPDVTSDSYDLESYRKSNLNQIRFQSELKPKLVAKSQPSNMRGAEYFD